MIVLALTLHVLAAVVWVGGMFAAYLCLRPAASVLQALEARRILGGLNLKEYYPELGDAVLVCATETKTSADMENYVTQLGDVIRNS